MKKGIAVLSNNIGFLKTLLRNLTEQDMLDTTLILVNEVRVKNLINDITNEVSKYDFDYVVLSSDTINQKFKEDVVDNDFVNEYTMSMNILMLWYIHKYLNFDKVLFIDDDVVLLPKFSEVFNIYHNGFYNHRLCAGSTNFYDESKRNQQVFLEWFNIFDKEFSPEFWQNYLRKYINTGQFMVCKNEIDIPKYESKLKLFFNSSIIKDDWDRGKVHTSGYMDEKFITLFFIEDEYESINSFVKLFLGIKNISAPTHQTILHIAASSHKYEVYNYLIDNNCIVGDKFPDIECHKTKLGFSEKSVDADYKTANLW